MAETEIWEANTACLREWTSLDCLFPPAVIFHTPISQDPRAPFFRHEQKISKSQRFEAVDDGRSLGRRP